MWLLFEEAKQKQPTEREAFLKDHCADNSELCREVVRLLAQDEAITADFLARPILCEVTFPPPAPAADALIGQRVGAYQLQQRIGSGGMGVVYLGRRVEDYEHRVAVKLIKHGLQSAEALRRFQDERQVLAALSHPHIARLLDGGSLDGQPYLVMEYIEGQPIDEYCRSHQLTIAQRLELFRSVCAAVQYAHQNLVLHRDLKPGNILVGIDGTPKLLDFGIAKFLNPQAWGRPDDATRTAGLLLTPEYASPEQIHGRKTLTTSSDVYALGVVLYELLTEHRPHEAAGRSAYELARSVCEDEPPPPRRWRPELPRDLEAICLKCLHKEPGGRYGSAADLADDLERWDRGEPIRARRVGRLERAVKWVRRKPALAGAVAAVVLVVVLGSVAAVSWQEQRQRDREGAAAARAQAEVGLTHVVELRQNYRFADADEMLKQVRGWARQAADGDLDGKLDRAEADLKLARDLDRVRLEAATLVDGKWDPRRVRAQYPKVLTRHGLDVREGDLDHLAQTIRVSAVRESIVAALDDWARAETDRPRKQRLLRLANRADEPGPWRQAVRQALAQRDEKRLRQLVSATGEDKPTPGVVLLLANAFALTSEEPTAMLRRMQLEQPRDFWVSFALGHRLGQQKKHQEAAECFRVTVALRPDIAVTHYGLGLALYGKKKVDEAIACFKKALDIDPRYAPAHNNLGMALHAQGDVEGAMAGYRQAIALAPKFALAHYNLGVALHDKRKLDEAIACFKKALDLDPKYAPAHNNLGNALQDKALQAKDTRSREEGLDQAITWYHKAIALDPKYAKAHYSLGVALHYKGKVDDAIACYQKAIDIDPKDARPHYNLGAAWHDKKKLDDAIACYQKAIDLDPKLVLAHTNLGNALKDKGKVERAIECYHRAIAIDPKFAQAHGLLGLALMQQGQFSKAHKSLRCCLVLLPVNHPLRDWTSHQLRQCQHWLDTDGKLKAYLAGEQPPANAASLVQMASLAQQPYKRLYHTAARLYCDALARQPQLANAHPHRYNAACAAALAGCGKGEQGHRLPEQQRTRWRQQALDWLRADLTWLARALDKADSRTKIQIQRGLERWRTNIDLTGVRDKAALENLPEAERKRWQQLWVDVESLRQRAGNR
jgi:serine/threonine-protein kinase